MRGSPRVMLVAISPEKRNTSCKTKPKLAAQFLFIPFANVDAVDQDRAALDIVKSAQRRDDRGFAAAGGADQSDFFAGTHAKRNTFEHRLIPAR